MPRQRSGRGPPAGPPPPPQPLPGRPRLVPNALPRAHGGDAERGAEGSGGAVRLASNPLRVRLGGRALRLQAAELRGAWAAAGRACGCGACGRLRGVRGVRAAATRAGTQAAVVGRAGGGRGARGRLWGVRAAATRAGTQAAVVGRAGGRGMHGESRDVHAAAAGGARGPRNGLHGQRNVG